jgi:hypothetical protein
VILFASDFQDPPAMIPKLIEGWINGSKVVLLRKKKSSDEFFLRVLKSFYYKIITHLSENTLPINCTGSGLYDKSIIELLKKTGDFNPYLRGFTGELGIDPKYLDFNQPKRLKGKSKSDFKHLYEVGFLGLINHTKIHFKVAFLTGLLLSTVSVLFSMSYFFYKVFNWQDVPFGLTPIICGVYFIGGMQLVLLSIIGEFLFEINRNRKNLPLVIEKNRINF